MEPLIHSQVLPTIDGRPATQSRKQLISQSLSPDTRRTRRRLASPGSTCPVLPQDEQASERAALTPARSECHPHGMS
jgi:hypothetical protein